MASEGLRPAQVDIFVTKRHPAAKALEGVTAPTPEQKQKLMTP